MSLSCPHQKLCGGCQMLALPYPEQLVRKQAQMQRLFGKLCPVRPILGMDDPAHYRCKVQAAVGTLNGRTVTGLYQPSSHRLVPVEHCWLEDERAAAVFATARQLMDKLRLPAYNDVTHTGLVRHLLVRVGKYTGEVMLVVVTGSAVFPARAQFVAGMRAAHPELTTIVQSVNGRRTSMVLGDRFRTLYGPGYIRDRLCGCEFLISPASFYQVNPVQTQRLYTAALEMAGLTGTETVIDAYCGTGTIGIIAAKKAGQVLGVELNRSAVQDAQKNARLNHVKNIRFVCDDAGRFMTRMAAEGQRADLVLMDPPRQGSSPEFLRALQKLKPKTVVYISCGPDTQRRDAEWLCAHGWRAVQAQPVDLFPFTDHCENILLFTRK